MSVAMIDAGASRAAVMAWRDDATLTAMAMAMVHEAAAAAMRALNGRLDTIANAEAIMNPATAARAIVRPAMRDGVGASADQWFTAQARTLRRVDARLEALALQFAAMGWRPVLPEDDARPTGSRFARALRYSIDGVAAVDQAFARLSPLRRLPIVRGRLDHLSAQVGHVVGEHSGAHDRVRVAGRSELTHMWIGPAPAQSDARPYLTQLLNMIDETARAARETLA